MRARRPQILGNARAVADVGDRQLRTRQRRQHAAQADGLIEPRQRTAVRHVAGRNCVTASSITPPCALAGSTSIVLQCRAALAQRRVVRGGRAIACRRRRACRSESCGPAAPRCARAVRSGTDDRLDAHAEQRGRDCASCSCEPRRSSSVEISSRLAASCSST